MLVLFCWTWGFPWVLKFKFSFFFRPWKVLKLDTGAEKVLIFVHCGPDKPNHSSDISVMWFPWSWSWHVTVTMCYGLVSELVRCVYSALESVTMLWHPQKLLWHYYLLLLSLFSQSILKAINSTTIIPDFSIFLVLKGPEKSWNSSLEVWTLWTVEDIAVASDWCRCRAVLWCWAMMLIWSSSPTAPSLSDLVSSLSWWNVVVVSLLSLSGNAFIGWGGRCQNVDMEKNWKDQLAW